MDQGSITVNGHYVIINFVLKGGPPWGFRIRQRVSRVVISKVNFGGRAFKNGLKVNDEILAVNNLVIDKHPLTLERDIVSAFGNSRPETPQLTKLDFTYQLIKHTLNRQLHLTIKRLALNHLGEYDGQTYQQCCYFPDDEPASNEVWPFPELQSQSEEEVLSPSEDQDYSSDHHYHPAQSFSSSGPQGHSSHPGNQSYLKSQYGPHQGPPNLNSSIYHTGNPVPPSVSLPSFEDSRTIINLTSTPHHHHTIHPHLHHPPPQHQQQQSLHQHPSQQTSASQAHHHLQQQHQHQQQQQHQQHQEGPYSHQHQLLPQHQRLSQLPTHPNLLPSFEDTCVPNLPPTDHPSNVEQFFRDLFQPPPPREPRPLTGPDLRLDSHRFVRTPSDESMAELGPKFKAKAPKNIWSPGSTTTSCSSSNSPIRGKKGMTETMAIATQTTPEKVDLSQVNGSCTLPRGFRPVRLGSSISAHGSPEHKTVRGREPQEKDVDSEDRRTQARSEPALTLLDPGHLGIDIGPLSPSDISEISIDTSATGRHHRDAGEMASHPENITPPSSPQLKYWTLPRNISMGNRNGSPDPDLETLIRRGTLKRIHTTEDPPSGAKLLYESASTKYYTLPATHHDHRPKTTTAPTATSSGPTTATTYSIPNVKYRGIGPVNDQGVPLSLRTGVEDTYGTDWYKTMYKRLHTLDKTRSKSEARIPVKSSRSKDANYFSDDETSLPRPRHISEYVTGSSSISDREKQMFYADLITYIDTIFSDVFKSTFQSPREIRNYRRGDQPLVRSTSEAFMTTQEERMRIDRELEMACRAQEEKDRATARAKEMDHQKTCVFTALTNRTDAEGNDASFVMRKNDNTKEPASRSTYIAIQKGETDIPISGLQKPAPHPRTHKDSQHKFNEDQVTIRYRTPVTQLRNTETFPNKDDFSSKQTEIQKYYEESNRVRGTTSQDQAGQSKHHFHPNQQAVVQLNRFQKAFAQKGFTHLSQIPLARALYDFHAFNPKELSVKKGDVVIILRPVNHNWLEVEDTQSGLKSLAIGVLDQSFREIICLLQRSKGSQFEREFPHKKGIVPRTYLDVEQEGRARAKFNFEAKTPVELELRKGENLRLNRKVDDNWYEGFNERNEVGIFPVNYVHTIKNPIYLRLNNNMFSSTPSPQPRSGSIRSGSPTMVSRSSSPSRPRSMPHFASVHRSAHGDDSQKYSSSMGNPATPCASSSGAATAAPTRPARMFRVIYPYKPNQVDELQLTVGDILSVTMQCDDGWFVGQSTANGNYGTFPGNYVQPIQP